MASQEAPRPRYFAIRPSVAIAGGWSSRAIILLFLLFGLGLLCFWVQTSYWTIASESLHYEQQMPGTAEMPSLKAPICGGQYEGGIHYSEMWWYTETIEPGQLVVSFSSSGGPIDFWILTLDQFDKWHSIARPCSDRGFPSTYSQIDVFSGMYTLNVPPEVHPVYYFAFENRNQGGVTVTLNIDQPTRVQPLGILPVCLGSVFVLAGVVILIRQVRRR